MVGDILLCRCRENEDREKDASSTALGEGRSDPSQPAAPAPCPQGCPEHHLRGRLVREAHVALLAEQHA